MAYTVHDPGPFYAAVLARLETSTGRPIGFIEKPEGGPPDVYPYSVVYPQPDELREGALNDPNQIVWLAWRVISTADGPVGAQWMQHKVRLALEGWTPTVTGLGTTPIQLPLGGGVERQDSPPPPLFYVSELFTALTSI